MKRHKLIIGLVLLLGLAVCTWPVTAQDDDLSPEQQELAEIVEAALESVAEQGSYTAVIETTMDQTISFEQGFTTLELVQTMYQAGEGQVVLTEDGDVEMSMTATQEFSQTGMGQDMEFSMSMEIILVDDTFYLRISDMDNTLAGLFPEGWINLTEDAGTIPGMDIIDWDNFTGMLNFDQLFPISIDMISDIVELESEMVGKQEMRVFEISVSTERFFEENSEMLAGMFDPSMLEGTGIDTDTFFEDMMAGMQLQYTLWVGADDGLPYRTDSVTLTEMEIDVPALGGPMQLSQEITSSTLFSDFNEPVEIEAPDME